MSRVLSRSISLAGHRRVTEREYERDCQNLPEFNIGRFLHQKHLAFIMLIWVES